MAEAALVEEMQVPNGGIADFVMSDEDIEAVYGPDDDGAEEYGTEGLGQFTDVANQMAAKGRYGDDLVAHVESGELVIPKDFLDRDPELKRSLFKYLEDHGIENPERYVVGSDANSINPETGMPEFFFKKLKKAAKKVAKTVSKVAKPVVKIIQKMAPVVLPIALSMTGLGPVFGAALGGGIASLINGGSIKDAFKQALIKGAMGAVYAGVGGIGTEQGFFGSIGNAVSNPMARLGQTLTGAQNSLTRLAGGEVAANAPGFFSNFVKPAAQAASSAGDVSQQVAQATTEPLNTASAYQTATGAPAVPTTASAQTLDPAFSSDFASSAYKFETPYVGMPPGGPIVGAGSKFAADSAMAASYPTGPEPFDIGGFAPTPGGGQQTTSYLDMTVPTQDIGDFAVGNYGTPQPSFLDKVQDYGQQTLDFFDPTKALSPAEEAAARAQGVNNYFKGLPGPTKYTLETAPADIRALALKAGEVAVAQAQPGFLSKFGPITALGLGAVYAGGGFDTPETTTPGLIPQKTGSDIVKENPYLYRTHDLGYQRLNPETGEYETVQNPYPDLDSYVVPTQYTYNLAPITRPARGPFERPVMAADGGPIFPRRSGGIMPDEGVPGKDSVRAMLMPGEFVMTTDAVRGAGGGNLNRGINNMYTVMRNLESRGRRIA